MSRVKSRYSSSSSPPSRSFTRPRRRIRRRTKSKGGGGESAFSPTTMPTGAITGKYAVRTASQRHVLPSRQRCNVISFSLCAYLSVLYIARSRYDDAYRSAGFLPFSVRNPFRRETVVKTAVQPLADFFSFPLLSPYRLCSGTGGYGRVRLANATCVRRRRKI